MLPIINFDNLNLLKPCHEMSPVKRRTIKSASHDRFTCSQQSILIAMDRFVKSVNNMDATVLVPSKLRDMETVGLKLSQRIPSALSNADLHSFYLMLNDVKKELMWGTGTVTPASHSYLMSSNGGGGLIINRSNSVVSSHELKHTHSRQTSDDSLGSLGSSASSSASDTDSEADSMITDRDSINDDHTTHLAAAFRHHLQGLHSILHQLADSADYLSSRYQQEIDDFTV